VKAAGETLLVVGSLHHDLMLDAPHLPRQGETVTGHRWYPKFGGKGGNQAVAAARAGTPVRMLGAVGDDTFAALLRDTLVEERIDTQWVATVASHATGISVAISQSDGDYGAVIVSGANLAIDPEALTEASLWDDVGLLLLQNEVAAELNLSAALQARRRGIRVCLNAAPARELDPALASSVDLLIVNALEAAALCQRQVDSIADGLVAAEELAQRHATAIVTIGGNGVAIASDGTIARHLPAIPIDVSSTHGAGDTFTGVLCAALLHGNGIDNAVDAANRAAADHVAGHTTTRPDR
jgi:ribokinase